MTRVEIQRSKWSRGGLKRNALLVDENTVTEASKFQYVGEHPVPVLGTKCCLGFACVTLGVSEADMAGIGMPDGLHEEWSEQLGCMLDIVDDISPEYGSDRSVCNRDWVNDAQEVNDASIGDWLSLCSTSERITLESEAQREKLITELFAQGGLEAVFVD